MTIGLKPLISSSASRHWLIAASSRPIHNVLQRVDLRFGNDREQRQVDGIHAFAQHGPLPTTLARHCAVQERSRILEVVALHDAAKRLARRQRLAVAGVHVADLAFGNR